MSLGWIVVIPVKGTESAKSRLGGEAVRRGEFALAIALDTVQAALATANVSAVIVVTSAGAAPAFRALGARVVREETRTGLNAAIRTGLQEALVLSAPGGGAGSAGTAVLLGDVPALRPGELAAALAAAERHPLSMVADADAIGTVLITALPGRDHAVAFGGASRAAHLAAGYVELEVADESGLRRDVDTLEQLTALGVDRVGPRTAALIAPTASV